MSVLNQPVLVLNKNWKAIGTISVQDAIVKLFSTYKDGTPKAKVIEPESYQLFSWNDWGKIQPFVDDEVIRASNVCFRVPELIILTKYEKLPIPKSNFNRRTLYKRDNNQCQYCLKKKPTSELSIDHVVPRSRGGLTNWYNCVLACIDCNSKKSNRTPEEANMKLNCLPDIPKFEMMQTSFTKKVKSWETFIGNAYWLCPLDFD